MRGLIHHALIVCWSTKCLILHIGLTMEIFLSLEIWSHPTDYVLRMLSMFFTSWSWLLGAHRVWYDMICSALIGFHCVTAAIKMRSYCRQGREEVHPILFLKWVLKCVKGMKVHKQGWGWGSATHTPYLGNCTQRDRFSRWGWWLHSLRTGQIHAEG